MISPIVSVIMPVYNSEKYLSEAIESILAQTLTDFEFLIFDDGSTDNSKLIIDSYAKKDKRIYTYCSSQNQGYTLHLNIGLEKARGPYIARMDSDDISMPNRLEDQVNFLNENPSVVVVGSSSIIIDESSSQIGLDIRQSDSSYLFWQSFFTNPVSHPTVMFRKEVVLNIGSYDINKEPSEDYDLWTRILKKNDISNIIPPLLKYRKHTNSISITKSYLQFDNSCEALKAHWQNHVQRELSGDLVRFLKEFHKGYDGIDPVNAKLMFWYLVRLRKLIKARNGHCSYLINCDFVHKAVYLAIKVLRNSLFKGVFLFVNVFISQPNLVLKRIFDAK